MDIKLKRSAGNPGVVFVGMKTLAYVLCVALLVTSAAVGLNTFVKTYFALDEGGGYYNYSLGDILMADSYENSSTCQMDFHDKAWAIKESMDFLDGTVSTNNVVTGDVVSQSSDMATEIYYDNENESSLYRDYLREKYQYFMLEGVSADKEQRFLDSLNDDVPIMSAGVIDEVSAKAAFLSAYAEQLQDMKTQREREQKENREEAQKTLNNTEGFWYYASDGKEAITNLPGSNMTAPAAKEVLRSLSATYQLVEDGRFSKYPEVTWNEDNSYQWIDGSIQEIFSEDGSNYTVYMGFDQNYVDQQNVTIKKTSDILQTGLALLGSALAGALICLVYLIIVWGKRDENGIVNMRGISRWFTDIHIALFALATGLVVPLMYMMVSAYVSMYRDYQQVHPIIFGLWGVGMTLLLAVSVLTLLEIIKKIKAKRFFRDMILIRLLRLLWHGIMTVFNGTTVVKKSAIIAALVCIGSATIFFFPLMLIAAVYVAVRYAKMFEKIKQGVKIVKNGDPEHKIDTSELAGELLCLAEDINELSSGFDVAVKQELKNQRLKTELISNVSHDIKTPLTSIITYVDLLKKEGLDSPDAPKYLDILDQKSLRLKNLTEDLFEAAKASSGDIPVNLEKVEIMSLINQGLGEMDRKLQQRGLEVIIKAQEERYNVLADGQLLWRVVENILGNVVKYAQENSRVYIDLLKTLDTSGKVLARVEFKNISQNSLNIPSDELMERFKRGDESRNTEGSGLGLSIAKDLMEIQNGDFAIVIDGDLFKAIFTLEIYEE